MAAHIYIKYFGKLTEIIGNTNEVIHIDENQSVEAIELNLLNRYNQLQNETYILFLNNTKISTKDIPLKHNDELCFMPLFTGG